MNSKILRVANHTHALSILSALAIVSGCSSSKASSTTSGPSVDGGSDGGRLYVSIYSAGEVSVLNATTYEVLDHVTVGKGTAILLETPDHGTLYTANWLDNSVSEIDVKTRTVNTLPLGSRPWVIAMSPGGETLYAGLGSNQIAVIDVATNTVTRSIPTPQLPESVIVSPDGKTLYVALFTDSTLEALDSATGAVTEQPIKMGSIPAWAAISPDGSKVYALNFLTNDVSVVDTASWAVTATVPVIGVPHGDAGAASNPITAATTPDGSILAVTNFGEGGVSLIDTKTNLVTHSFPIDGRTVGVGFSPDGQVGYATDLGSASFAVDPVTLVLNGSFASVTTVPGDLTVFDPESGVITKQVPLGTGPTSVVAMVK